MSDDAPIEIYALWEYGDPAESERRFRAALDSFAAPDHRHAAARLELLTQIARTLGLRRRFDEAHAMLDGVERDFAAARIETGAAQARVLVRLLLERGRTINSSGDPPRARSLFIAAWEVATKDAAGRALEGLAVDAAHMVAITFGGTAEGIDWNERGLALARRSQETKARGLVPALLNNMAWDLHGLGRFDEALARFEEARAAWTERGRRPQIRVARWSVARCLRSLGRHQDALEILAALEAEPDAAGTNDGFVFEEVAENLAALGRREEARPYFRRAGEALAKVEWLARSEPARLASLVERGADSKE